MAELGLTGFLAGAVGDRTHPDRAGLGIGNVGMERQPFRRPGRALDARMTGLRSRLPAVGLKRGEIAIVEIVEEHWRRRRGRSRLRRLGFRGLGCRFGSRAGFRIAAGANHRCRQNAGEKNAMLPHELVPCAWPGLRRRLQAVNLSHNRQRCQMARPGRLGQPASVHGGAPICLRSQALPCFRKQSRQACLMHRLPARAVTSSSAHCPQDIPATRRRRTGSGRRCRATAMNQSPRPTAIRRRPPHSPGSDDTQAAMRRGPILGEWQRVCFHRP